MSRVLLSLCVGAVVLGPPRADEGMWLYTNPPREILKTKYHFEPDAKWLEHLQKSSVRFASGGSGSFVSPEGLVMTNHHVGLSVLQQISKPGGKNYVKDGFWAQTHDKEVKAEQEELNVLMKIQDVTKEVNNAVKGDMSPEKAAEARRAAISGIEKDGLEQAKKDGIDPAHTEVATLYNGNQFHLYTYKKYTDVRLVFAPEQQIAFYGGDPDNFEYPRLDLDMCFFRVYENDKPVKIEHYLKWSKAGAKDDELIFVSGHPGHTDRLNTVADLEYQRDRIYPFSLQLLNRMEVALSVYSGQRSEENARRAKTTLFGVQNSRKARLYGLEGLLDPAIMNKKKEQEKKLRAAVNENSDLKEAAGAWDKIAAVQKTLGQNSTRYNMLEGGRGFNSSLFGIARVLLRAGEELPKPNGDRLREYSDSNIDAMKERLFSKAPIYPDFETVKLTDSLTFLASQMGADDPIVKKVMAGKAPNERAASLIAKTKLLKDQMGPDGKVTRVKNVEYIKELFDGGKDAVTKAKDPMIELARGIDEESRRKVRKTVEAQNEIKERAYDQIAKAKFVIEGTNTYPDATFTLRLSFGVVKGYEEGGKHIPFETTFAGLYERSGEHKDKPPFDLPKLWVERKSKLDLSTPFNFVCTADIIGGNSGSPVVNREGEVVGLIFDGNLQSLVLDFVFTEVQSRAVAVHSRGIIEMLRKVYDAGPLADEITGMKK